LKMSEEVERERKREIEREREREGETERERERKKRQAPNNHASTHPLSQRSHAPLRSVSVPSAERVVKGTSP